MTVPRRRIPLKRLSADTPPPTDKVGYAKPPIETRFKPGHSGNPKGRPRGAKNKPKPMKDHQEMSDIIAKVAALRLPVTQNGQQTSMPMIEAITHATAVDAVKGNRGARRDFIKLYENAGRELRQRMVDASNAEQQRWNKLTTVEMRNELEQSAAALGLKLPRRSADDD